MEQKIINSSNILEMKDCQNLSRECGYFRSNGEA